MYYLMSTVWSFLFGYLVGAIPFGVICGRIYGISIFEHGSGNPGATNVLRVLGKKQGYSVFALDAAKGLVAVLFINVLGDTFLCYVGLFGALIGHSFSVFIKFRGGKGVATLIGGLSLLVPLPLLSALIVWLLVFYITKYVSLASLCFSFALPIFADVFGLKDHIMALSIFAFLVIFRHRRNIKRLLLRKENRF